MAANNLNPSKDVLDYIHKIADQIAKNAQRGYMNPPDSQTSVPTFEPTLTVANGQYSYSYTNSFGKEYTIGLNSVAGFPKAQVIIDSHTFTNPDTGAKEVDERAARALWNHPDVQKEVYNQVATSVTENLSSSAHFVTTVYDQIKGANPQALFAVPTNYQDTPSLNLTQEVTKLNSLGITAYTAQAANDAPAAVFASDVTETALPNANQQRVGLDDLIKADSGIHGIKYDANVGLYTEQPLTVVNGGGGNAAAVSGTSPTTSSNTSPTTTAGTTQPGTTQPATTGATTQTHNDTSAHPAATTAASSPNAANQAAANSSAGSNSKDAGDLIEAFGRGVLGSVENSIVGGIVRGAVEGIDTAINGPGPIGGNLTTRIDDNGSVMYLDGNKNLVGYLDGTAVGPTVSAGAPQVVVQRFDDGSSLVTDGASGDVIGSTSRTDGMPVNNGVTSAITSGVTSIAIGLINGQDIEDIAKGIVISQVENMLVQAVAPSILGTSVGQSLTTAFAPANEFIGSFSGVGADIGLNINPVGIGLNIVAGFAMSAMGIIDSKEAAMGAQIGAIIGSIWGPVGSVIGQFLGGIIGGLFADEPDERYATFVNSADGNISAYGEGDSSVFGHFGFVNTESFGGDMDAGADAFAQQIIKMDNTIATGLKLTETQIEHAKDNLAQVNFRYDFGQEETGWHPSSRIITDRYAAVLDAVDPRIGDLLRFSNPDEEGPSKILNAAFNVAAAVQTGKVPDAAIQEYHDKHIDQFMTALYNDDSEKNAKIFEAYSGPAGGEGNAFMDGLANGAKPSYLTEAMSDWKAKQENLVEEYKYQAQEAREAVVAAADPNLVAQYNEYVAKYKEAEAKPPVMQYSGKSVVAVPEPLPVLPDAIKGLHSQITAAINALDQPLFVKNPLVTVYNGKNGAASGTDTLAHVGSASTAGSAAHYDAKGQFVPAVVAQAPLTGNALVTFDYLGTHHIADPPPVTMNHHYTSSSGNNSETWVAQTAAADAAALANPVVYSGKGVPDTIQYLTPSDITHSVMTEHGKQNVLPDQSVIESYVPYVAPAVQPQTIVGYDYKSQEPIYAAAPIVIAPVWHPPAEVDDDAPPIVHHDVVAAAPAPAAIGYYSQANHAAAPEPAPAVIGYDYKGHQAIFAAAPEQAPEVHAAIAPEVHYVAPVVHHEQAQDYEDYNDDSYQPEPIIVHHEEPPAPEVHHMMVHQYPVYAYQGKK